MLLGVMVIRFYPNRSNWHKTKVYIAVALFVVPILAGIVEMIVHG